MKLLGTTEAIKNSLYLFYQALHINEQKLFLHN